MKFRIFIFTISILIAHNYIAHSQSSNPHIHVDQFGYLPDAEKVAVISNPQIGYNTNLNYNPSTELEIRDANTDEVVLTQTISIWNNGNTHAQSGDKGWWLDFSELSTFGEYYIFDPSNNESSATFRIANNVYKDVLNAAMKMFYYNRCNASKNAPYADNGWTDGMNFTNPFQDANCRYVYDSDNAALEKDLTGGWFDAGDYNKYTTFAHDVIHNLLSAYEENTNIFTDDWNIPESGNGIPDMLDEIKWELDWMMKMNNADGSTHIKMGSIDYGENAAAPPSANFDQRYYGPTCSSASITIASTFSHAALVFEQYASTFGYSQDLLSRAETSFSYFKNLYDNNQLEFNCDDGTIKAGIADMDYDKQMDAAVIAAAYLFDMTGNNIYKQFFDDHYSSREPIANNYWSGYKISLYDALFLYAANPNATTSVANAIIQNIENVSNNNWDGLYGFNNEDLYRAYAPSSSYHWGSNMPKAGFGLLNLQLANNNINPNVSDTYERKAAELLHYFHGVNPIGLVHLSNMYSLGGDHCVNEIYHTWFNDGTQWDNALSSTYGPPPGYLTGGANASFSVTTISPPSGQPEQKSYLDFNDGYPNDSWEISEPAIYYQAAYIRLLANYTRNSTTPNTDIVTENYPLNIYPNPSNEFIEIKVDNMDTQDAEIINVDGKRVLSIDNMNEPINISNLETGIYYIRIGNRIGKFVKI